MPIVRDDLIIINKRQVGERRVYGYDYGRETGTQSVYGKHREYYKGSVPKYRIYIWHRKCYYNRINQEDWYHPGVYAEEIPETELPAGPSRMPVNYKFKPPVELPPEPVGPSGLPADYKFKPVVDLPEGDEPDNIEDNPRRMNMRKRSYRSSSSSHEGPNINYYYTAPQDGGPGASRAPSALVQSYTPAKKGSSTGLIIGLLVLAGAAFAGYWFLYKSKYHVGDILEHDTEVGKSYQITAMKYSGITHMYVMSADSGATTVEHKVSDIDKDTTWNATSSPVLRGGVL